MRWLFGSPLRPLRDLAGDARAVNQRSGGFLLLIVAIGAVVLLASGTRDPVLHWLMILTAAVVYATALVVIGGLVPVELCQRLAKRGRAHRDHDNS